MALIHIDVLSRHLLLLGNGTRSRLFLGSENLRLTRLQQRQVQAGDEGSSCCLAVVIHTLLSSPYCKRRFSQCAGRPVTARAVPALRSAPAAGPEPHPGPGQRARPPPPCGSSRAGATRWRPRFALTDLEGKEQGTFELPNTELPRQKACCSLPTEGLSETEPIIFLP